MASFTIPYNFIPRYYQVPIYNCIPQGFRRGIAIWHRRAGKDKTFINIMAREAFKQVGTYWYVLPYYKQARDIIWEGMDKHGFRFRDHIPQPLIKRLDNQQMVIELVNGSFIRLKGSDNIDTNVGTNPLGVIYSEFSLHKPEAWYFIKPILLENDGWALFNGTHRGKNELWKMFMMAKQHPGWFAQLLTVEDTYREDGRHVITEEMIENERLEGTPEEIIQQEYYCSFDAGLAGAYFSDLMAKAASDGRIGRVPWEPRLPVYTAWDLGFNDTNTIWFIQIVSPREYRIIDLIHNTTKDAGYYVNEIQRRPYTYIDHFLPHDVEVHEWSTGETRRQKLEDLGLHPITTIPRMGPGGTGLVEGISAVRSLIPKCYFDEYNCAMGIEGLKSFRREKDAKLNRYRDQPVQDWSKHFADAFRIGAWGIQLVEEGVISPLQTSAYGSYDELSDSYMDSNYNELEDYLNPQVVPFSFGRGVPALLNTSTLRRAV